MKLLALAVLASGSVVSADPEPRLYTTTSLGAAIIHTDCAACQIGVTTQAMVVTRWSLGLALGPRRHGMNGRLGAFAELYVPLPDFDVYPLVGMEGQLDWDLDACWRLGVRLAGGRAVGPMPYLTDGAAALVGVAARTPNLKLGFDVIGARTVSGAVVTVGLEGRPALITSGVLAVAVAIVGSLVLAMHQ